MYAAEEIQDKLTLGITKSTHHKLPLPHLVGSIPYPTRSIKGGPTD